MGKAYTLWFTFLFGLSNPKIFNSHRPPLSETSLQVSSYSVCPHCTCSVFWLWFRALVCCHCLAVPVLTFHKPRISFLVPAACVKIDMFSFLVVDMLVAM